MRCGRGEEMEWINWISKLMIPALIVFIPLYAAYFRKVPVYESFVEGAKEGFPTAVQIIPHLVGMMVAVSIFRETGAMQFYLKLFQPLLSLIHFPEESFPLALLRPISGAGSLSYVECIFRAYGTES